MCLREERIVPQGWEVARGRKTHGLQYGFRIRLPLRREFCCEASPPRGSCHPGGRGLFFFHRIKLFRAAPPQEDFEIKKGGPHNVS